MRAQAEGEPPPPMLMDLVNFKFVTHDTAESGLLDDYLRVYNVPDRSVLGRFPALAADAAFVHSVAASLGSASCG